MLKLLFPLLTLASPEQRAATLFSLNVLTSQTVKFILFLPILVPL